MGSGLRSDLTHNVELTASVVNTHFIDTNKTSIMNFIVLLYKC